MRDFDADATDRTNRQAEELVGRWLRGRYDAEVIDRRDSHGAFDWQVRWGFTLDVKTSRWLDKDDRVHYEYRHLYDGGGEGDGWSVKEGLDYVVYVNRATLEAHLIAMREWRAWVEDRLWHATEQGREKPEGWIHSEARSRSRTGSWRTLAWSIPLNQLREAELVWHSWQLAERGAA